MEGRYQSSEHTHIFYNTMTGHQTDGRTCSYGILCYWGGTGQVLGRSTAWDTHPDAAVPQPDAQRRDRTPHQTRWYPRSFGGRDHSRTHSDVTHHLRRHCRGRRTPPGRYSNITLSNSQRKRHPYHRVLR